MPSWLNRAMRWPCVVHTRYQDPENRDEHGNPVYIEDSYPALVFVSPLAKTEDPTGRSAENAYQIFLDAADVFAHLRPGPRVFPPSGPQPTLDAFSWFELDGLGRVECDGDPSFLVSIRNPSVVHHVEVQARLATSADRGQ